MAEPNSQDMILGEMRGQLREVVHSMNNLGSKFDGLSREVIGLGPLASDVAELKVKVASLETAHATQEGERGVWVAILKSPQFAWVAFLAAGAWAILTGKVHP